MTKLLDRDFDKNPYSPEEERVAKFLSDKGVGGGPDPIGALLASYDYLLELRNSLAKTVAEYTAKYGHIKPVN